MTPDFARRLASLAAVVATLTATSPAAAQNEGTPGTPPPAATSAPPAPSTDDAQPRGADASASAAPAPAPAPASAAPAPPAPTEAEAGRLPVSRAARPLTLPKLYLDASLDLSTTEWPVGRFTDATVGAALGITDDLTVRAVVAPLQLTSPNSRTSGGFHYGETAGTQGPTLTATYRFLRGDVELGAFAGGQLLTAFNLSGYRVWVGVPLRVHASKSVRLDVAPEMRFSHENNESAVFVEQGVPFGPQGTVSVGSIGPSVSASPAAVVRSTERYALFVPLDVTWSMTELFHAGINTGFVVGDLSSVKSSTRIPFGVYGGYTIAGARGPILDIDPYFDFPGLFRPGSSSQKTQTNWNEIGITLRAHADLL